MTSQEHNEESRLSSVVIEAIAYELAPRRVSSAELEEQLADTMDRLRLQRGHLERLTGIRERGYWEPGTPPSVGATIAARRALEMADIDPSTIGALINTSVCKDYYEPAVACLVHGNLQLPAACINYDVGNACVGFLNGMDVVSMMIEKGLIQRALVVDSEAPEEGIEATIRRLQGGDIDRKTFLEHYATLTLGSGAVAMVLSHVNVARQGHLINGSVSRAATEHNGLCLAQRDHMVVDGHTLMMAGIELAGQTWKVAEQELANWSEATLDHYIPHQVSVRHTGYFAEALGLSREKFFLNVREQGNIGPAAVPITLGMAADSGRFKSGDHIALIGVGSGVNCTLMSVTW